MTHSQHTQLKNWPFSDWSGSRWATWATTGHQSQKWGHFQVSTSICIPEASLNRRAPKLGRNVHLHRLSEISNVFFRTPAHARVASRNAKTRYGLPFGNYLT